MNGKEYRACRRVAGYHDIRLDGISDLALRARGASVLDIGCNRGMVCVEMYQNGAEIVHGCDNYVVGIRTACEVFADLRSVKSKFEVVDLLQGPKALAPFGTNRYDIVLMLATYHKIKRQMSADLLSDLVRHIGQRTIKYFGWRGTSTDCEENEKEIAALDADLGAVGIRRIHTSYISDDLGVAAIWARR